MESNKGNIERFKSDTLHTELTRVTGVTCRSNLHVEGFESPQLCTKLKLMKCKNVKGKDGFTLGKIYNLLFAGRVYWVENDYGERICDSDESFEPV